MKQSLLFLLIFTGSLFSFLVNAQDFPPPRNLQFDSLTLVATWEPPRITVLDEHFEGVDFPPPSWQDTTQGMGWFATTDGSSAALIIPPHTTYAVVNNDLAGAGNTGCCDHLITPELDLTQADGFTLSFNSFFRGCDAETATVEISTDGGNTWSLLLEVLPHFAWATLTIDLSSYSGPAGSQNVKLAFKANDNGNADATGWAIDDVVVMSDELEVYEYGIFYDGTAVSQTSETFIAFNPASFPLGFPPDFCVNAIYDFGFSYSTTVCADFPHYYLAPPQNLEAEVNTSTTGVASILTWQPPLESNTTLIGYNIYRDDTFLAYVQGTDTVYWDLNLAPGSYCYTISAVYDLTNLGFPGQIGESLLEGPACIENTMMIYLPFDEDWSTGQFDVNQWTIGENWVMDDGNGNPAPVAKFSSQPKLTNYSSNLVSFYMSAGAGKSSTPNCIWLDFDYSLDDISASGSEMITIQIWDGDTWTTVSELSNNGDVNWTTAHINITTLVWNKDFRIRFNMNGIDSELFNYWLIDNISVYHEYSFAPPANLAAVNTGNIQQNDIQVSWDIPVWENQADLIMDDSTWENTLTINPGYTGWLGNKFISGAGQLRSVNIMWLNNTNSSDIPLILDIFDAGHNLLGSSEEFVPVPGSWQTVTIPDLTFEGDFYAMVRFNGQSGITDLLGMDSTTSSGRPNNGWFYDGAVWSQMSTFGYAECIFSIRATIGLRGDCGIGDEPESNSGNKAKAYLYFEQTNMDSMKSTTGISGLIEYEVYRREYQIPVPGQDSLLTEWVLLGTAQTNSYIDQNLEFKCYQYYAQAMYNEGSSQQSNMDETCFAVGTDEPEAAGIKLYPNPAMDFLTIELKTPVELITVFDNTGRIINVLSVVNKSDTRIDVTGFPRGIYNLKFTTAKGESFSRKFVKM